MDPKIKNLIKFLLFRGGILFAFGYSIPYISGERDPLRIFAGIILLIAAWRISLAIYRRSILPAKKALSYGRWAIVTGSTSGIGRDFAGYLAKEGMSLLIISRTEQKLQEQMEEIKKLGVSVQFLAFDFTKTGQERDSFYVDLDSKCVEMNKDGGIGLLINNVGTANEYPKNLDEFSDQEVTDMINCNINSTIFMTRTVMKYMKARKSGAVVSISSGSGNHPTPMLVVYSATKAFITQFSRSMHVECWGTGVDFLVVTPYYVVSNLYKRKSGTLLAPMPIELIKGTMAQLGKKYIWQGHGYWFHGFLGNFAAYYWGTTARWKKMMNDNRKRYDDRTRQGQAEKATAVKKDE